MGKKVVWISADTIRAGAIAETKAYADAIGVPLRLAYTPEDLTSLIRTNQDADLILVDTPRITSYNVCYTKLLRAFREIVHQAAVLGVSDFLIKPFSMDILLARVNQVFEKQS